MRTLILALGLLALLQPCGTRAQGGKAAVARASIDCKDVTLRTALRTVLRSAGLKYQIAGDVPDVRVTLKLEQVPVEDAVKVLARQASFEVLDLEVKQTNGIFRVGTGYRDAPPVHEGAPVLPAAKPTAQLLVNNLVDVRGLRLHEAMTRLFAAGGATVVFDPDVNDAVIAASTPASNPWGMITQLLGAARAQTPELYLGQIGETYVVAKLGKLLPPRQSAPGPYGRPVRLITLKLDRVPLRAAIDAIFDGTGEQYSVFPNVPDVPITIELHDVSPQAALRYVLRMASKEGLAITFSKD